MVLMPASFMNFFESSIVQVGVGDLDGSPPVDFSAKMRKCKYCAVGENWKYIYLQGIYQEQSDGGHLLCSGDKSYSLISLIRPRTVPSIYGSMLQNKS